MAGALFAKNAAGLNWAAFEVKLAGGKLLFICTIGDEYAAALNAGCVNEFIDDWPAAAVRIV